MKRSNIAPACLLFFSEILRVLGRDKEFLHYEPDESKRRAGIERFDKFGHLNTMYALAGGDLLKVEQLYQLPYGEVFLKLYYDTESAKFQDRYREIVQKEK